MQDSTRHNIMTQLTHWELNGQGGESVVVAQVVCCYLNKYQSRAARAYDQQDLPAYRMAN
jgi:hypothetical protein